MRPSRTRFSPRTSASSPRTPPSGLRFSGIRVGAGQTRNTLWRQHCVLRCCPAMAKRANIVSCDVARSWQNVAAFCPAMLPVRGKTWQHFVLRCCPFVAKRGNIVARRAAQEKVDFLKKKFSRRGTSSRGSAARPRTRRRYSRSSSSRSSASTCSASGRSSAASPIGAAATSATCSPSGPSR